MKVYKSTRARNAICKGEEKYVTFGKDENGNYLITKDENDITREYRLSFSEDVIIIKSVSIGFIKFVADEVNNDIRIING